MKISRMIYMVLAWLFVAGVLVQVFLAGMVIVARQMGWGSHIGLGHTLGLPLIFMVATAYLGKLPGSLKRLTWLLLGVYILQADVLIFMRASAPVLSALHPVLALVDFALGLALAWEATVIVRAEETAAPAIPVPADGLSAD
jgi:hypothetical protein